MYKIGAVASPLASGTVAAMKSIAAPTAKTHRDVRVAVCFPVAFWVIPVSLVFWPVQTLYKKHVRAHSEREESKIDIFKNFTMITNENVPRSR